MLLKSVTILHGLFDNNPKIVDSPVKFVRLSSFLNNALQYEHLKFIGPNKAGQPS